MARESFESEFGQETLNFKAIIQRETAKAYNLTITEISERSGRALMDAFVHATPENRDYMEDVFSQIGVLKEKSVWLPKSKTDLKGKHEGSDVFSAPVWLLKAKAEEVGDF